MNIRIAATFAWLVYTCLVSAVAAQTPITVQIVNDSGLPDSQVFLLLGGQDLSVMQPDGPPIIYPFTASGIPTVNTGQTVSQAVMAAPLVCPPSPPPGCTGFARAQASTGGGLTVTSPYSGAVLPVYQFTATTVGSGTLYASYLQALSYLAAPTVTANYRFQPVEFTYSQYVPSTADLTTIDFYGIPIQLQTYAPTDANFAYALDTVTYYTSTPTLMDAFMKVSPNLKYAFMRTDGTPYDPATDSLANFARIVGPNQLAAPGVSPIQPPPNWEGKWPAGGGSPWPYPTFADYLDSLVAANYTFTEADTGIISAYTFNYTGTITGNSTSGWVITLTGTTNAPSPLPSNATITIPLPPQASPNGGADFVIYGAAQSCDTLQVSGFTCTATTINQIANSVYGWIQADVLSALNFGYMNTTPTAPSASNQWYGLPPIDYPFGAARTTNDGFYNIWAALVYNHSDAYGFAFSDRNGRPSPGISMPVGGTMRVWLLPDVRLDAPLVQVVSNDSSSISLSWPRVRHATSYEVTWSPPYTPGSSPPIPEPVGRSATVRYDIQLLDAGTPYTITVTAQNSTTNQQSVAVPIYASTGGTLQATSPANGVPFVFGFNWIPADPSNTNVYINGSQFSYSGGAWIPPAGMSALASLTDTASYVLNVTDGGGNVIWAANYYLSFTGTSTQYYVGQPGNFDTPAQPNFLERNAQPLVVQGTAPFPNPTTGVPTMGTPFTPIANKQAAPVVYPVQTPAPRNAPRGPKCVYGGRCRWSRRSVRSEDVTKS